jgi:hypothetical protein
MSTTAGPLLGSDVGNNKHKPKLQDGLLGDMDRRRNEISLIKKGGVVTAPDRATEILIPQLTLVVQRMMSQLYHPGIQPSHSVLDNLRGDVSVMFNLLSQYQNQKGGVGFGNDRMSMATPQQSNRLSMNPFAMPNISWKQTSTSASKSSSGYGKKTDTISSGMSESSGSYASTSESASGTENSSNRDLESSGTEDDDVPLGKSEVGSTESSSGGSESEESSESLDDEDVPLGLVTDGSKIKQYSSSSQASVPQRGNYSNYSQNSGSLNRPLVLNQMPVGPYSASNQQWRSQNPPANTNSSGKTTPKNSSISNISDLAPSQASSSLKRYMKKKKIPVEDSSEGSVSEESE